MAQIKRVRDLISFTESRSDGQGEKGARGRRRATAGDKSRGGAARDSPEFTKTGAPGVVSTWVWVSWHLRDMGKLMGPKARLGSLQGGESDGAGSEPRRSAVL